MVPFPPMPWTTEGTEPMEFAEAMVAAHATADRTVGVFLVRLGGYAAGVFTGTEPVLAASKVGSRLVHGRSAAGGQSQQRFARRRENQALPGAGGRGRIPHRRCSDLTSSTLVLGGDKRSIAGIRGDLRLAPLAKVLAGQAQPRHAGSVRRSGPVGYLPQDPRTGDLDTLAIDRVLSARGLDQLRADLRAAEAQMADPDSGAAAAAIRTYGRLEERLAVGSAGTLWSRRPPRITASLGLPDRVLHQPLHTLSGGQRRRVELARILFSDSETMLLDEPTNHLDADSVVWLRDHLKSYRGGLVVISHDVSLLADVVNKVFYLDAQRACLDMYNLGWQAYLQQRETDERRRRRERVNASRQAGALMAQADKMRAKATKARAAQNMQRRAERMLAGVEAERTADRVAKLRFPVPAPWPHPLAATGLSKSYGSTGGVLRRGRRRRPRQPGRGLGPQRRGKDDPAPTAGRDGNPGNRKNRARARPQPRILRPRAWRRIGNGATRSWRPHAHPPRLTLPESQQRKVLGSFLFSGDDVEKPWRECFLGGEKTRLALALLVVSGA